MMKAIRSVAGRVGAGLSAVITDVIWLVGAGLISYGAWLIYKPSGFIVAGTMMIGAATLLAATRMSQGNHQ